MTAQSAPPRRSFLPGVLVAVAVVAFGGGFASGGPDVIGGIVFGTVALAAAAVIVWREKSDKPTQQK
jgi:hypothetical protein